jgi:ferritin-like metal-binding protein YciE
MKKQTSKTKENTELHKLFVAQLKDIYWAEKKLATTLPKLAKKAQGSELKTAFTHLLKETKEHVQRLEKIFATLSLKPVAKKCHAMQGLLDEGDEIAEEYAGTCALDAALITAAQKVEHYEIATYGTLRAFAKRLGNTKAETLPTQTIDEEGAADKTLTSIAESSSNQEADA